jgi:hypothetical protein
MGLLDRLLGRPDRRDRTGGGGDEAYAPPPPPGPHASGDRGAATEDERALERYRYLLRTAPPEQVEQAHAEAFAKLTPEQRRQVLTELGSQVPASERARSDDPASLARMASRAELRQPGTLERSFSRGPYGGGTGGMGVGGMGMGGMLAGSLMASVAGAFVGTAIADAMFDASDGAGDYGGEDELASGGYGGDDPTGGGDDGGDFGGGDFTGGDFGGDFGGGDF